MDPIKKILIVDDEVVGREVLSEMLLDQSYAFLFAQDGESALAQVVEHMPDLILLDVMMPGINGYEVCDRIKSNASWRHIPIILITALDGKENLTRGINAGADDFLSKPVNRLELKARVRSMLRIKQQYDDLAQMVQLREDMAHMIVHDLRNPLSIMFGTSYRIRSRATSDTDINDADRLIRQARRLEAFMTDLLLMAKMERGKLALNPSTTDMIELTREAYQNHFELAHLKKVSLTMDLPDKPAEVFLDSALMRRVLDNLLSNAVKFSPARSTVTLRVTRPKFQALPTATAPRNGSKNGLTRPNPVQLQILDEGFGIPEDQRDLIFDKYHIVTMQKSNMSQIGLGLPFCKMVVDAHGGQIDVTANVPKGAIFTVTL